MHPRTGASNSASAHCSTGSSWSVRRRESVFDYRCVFPEHAKAVHGALRGPKQIEWTAGSQIDFYDQQSHVTNAVALAASHFRNTLGLTESHAQSVGART